MWKRLGLWDIREEKAPDLIGIVYEKIDKFRFVEPNRSQLSSYFKLFHKMDKRYQYECWLDLHQTEFQNSEFNCEMCFPIPKQTSESIERVNISWGKSIINEWIKLGYKPKPEPIPLGSGLPDSFVESWGPLNRRMNIINTEVKNNAPDASAEFQLKVQAIAIMKSIERIIG